MKKNILNYKGIAAFFLKKFGNKKPPNTQRPPTVPKRVLSPSQINTFDEPDARSTSRVISAISGMNLLGIK